MRVIVFIVASCLFFVSGRTHFGSPWKATEVFQNSELKYGGCHSEEDENHSSALEFFVFFEVDEDTITNSRSLQTDIDDSQYQLFSKLFYIVADLAAFSIPSIDKEAATEGFTSTDLIWGKLNTPIFILNRVLRL